LRTDTVIAGRRLLFLAQLADRGQLSGEHCQLAAALYVPELVSYHITIIAFGEFGQLFKVLLNRDFLFYRRFVFPLRTIFLFRFERCFIFLPEPIAAPKLSILSPPESRFLSPPNLPPLNALSVSRLRLKVFTLCGKHAPCH